MIDSSLNFDGYNELIRLPLESDDPESLATVTTILTSAAHPIRDAFNLIIHTLSGKSFKGIEARNHWRKIIGHKQLLEAKLGRKVSIRVCALDYFELQKPGETAVPSHSTKKMLRSLNLPCEMDDSLIQLFSAGYHLKILKKEMLRAKRYSHALSALLIDIDNFHTINETFSFNDGDNLLLFVAKIIQKTIRAVDVPASYSGDRFLIILPDTNKREAIELAGRLQAAIHDRTSTITNLSGGITVTIVSGQSSDSTNSLELLHALEHKLVDGKRTQRNAIYSL
jgi:diguanylate cyclase (GGDEF)-like protein